MNQFTEQWSVLQLAERVARVASAHGLDAPISHVENPRVESESHYYHARSSKLVDLGLEPHPLDDSTVAELLKAAVRHRDRVRLNTIAASVDWRTVPYWDAPPVDAHRNGVVHSNSAGSIGS
jgi:UDP-sulfoquinovose synthase